MCHITIKKKATYINRINRKNKIDRVIVIRIAEKILTVLSTYLNTMVTGACNKYGGVQTIDLCHEKEFSEVIFQYISSNAYPVPCVPKTIVLSALSLSINHAQVFDISIFTIP